MKFLGHLATITVIFCGIAFAAQPASVKSVATNRPCKPANVLVRGYLHTSRHGSWISDDPGLNGRGMPIAMGMTDFPGADKIQNYMFRPQVSRHNTFSASFTGITSCNKHGVPVLHLRKVEHIQIRRIRDAG